jgi:hypothetical protein
VPKRANRTGSWLLPAFPQLRRYGGKAYKRIVAVHSLARQRVAATRAMQAWFGALAYADACQGKNERSGAHFTSSALSASASCSGSGPEAKFAKPLPAVAPSAATAACAAP